MTKSKIGFRLLRITTDEFATLIENYRESEIVHYQTAFNFGVTPEKRIIRVQFVFQFTQANASFLKISVSGHFEVEQDAWDSHLNQKTNKVSFPKGFARHMAMLVVGTTRGILHAKTENTVLHRYMLPVLDLSEQITEDLKIEMPASQ